MSRKGRFLDISGALGYIPGGSLDIVRNSFYVGIARNRQGAARNRISPLCIASAALSPVRFPLGARRDYRDAYTVAELIHPYQFGAAFPLMGRWVRFPTLCLRDAEWGSLVLRNSDCVLELP